VALTPILPLFDTLLQNSIRHNLSSNRAFRNVAKSSDERGKGFMWGIDPKAERGLQDQDTKARQAELGRQQGHTGPVAAPGPSAPKVQPPVKPAFTTEPLTKFVTVKEKNPTDRKPVLSKMPKAPPVNGTASAIYTVSSSHPESAPPPATASTASSSLLLDTPAAPSSSSSGVPQLPSNVSLPIIVAPLPDSHPAASASAAALASSTSPASAILTTPPIVLHAGTLILNPTIFSHLTEERLKELEGMGAQKALEILQGHIVRFLKEKMRSEGGGRGRGRGRGRGGRVVNKGSRTEGSETKPIVKQEEQKDGSLGDKPSVQLLPSNSASEQPQTNGVDSTSEEHVMKKRKMDADTVDVDVDVIGP
jgi:forkhead box protein K